MADNAHKRQLIDLLYLIRKNKFEESKRMPNNAIPRLLRALLFIMRQKSNTFEMAPGTIKELLLSLREAREELISRTLNEDPQLFSSLFQYENDDNLLLLSFEREYSIFINSNLEKLCNNITDIEDEHIKIKLKNITEALLSFKGAKNNSFVNSVFISERIKAIEKILSTFDKGVERLEQMKYIHKKDKALFEREFNRLLGEQNDLD
ncbi:TPA: hypothetical protein ACSP8J_003936 [Aeromonas veronii]|uniref:hypothetical protein n=1 Tax=Aeromonas enteropelogenes TaxID=29489 RepID=UPI0038E2734C